MKNYKLNILLIVLLTLSVTINIFFLIKYNLTNKEEKKELARTQYKISSTFMISYPENNNIKYYADLSQDFIELVKTNENMQEIYGRYGINISDNIIIESHEIYNIEEILIVDDASKDSITKMD